MSYRNTLFLQTYYYSPFLVKNVLSSLYGWLQKRRRYGEFYHQHFQFLLDSQWYSNDRLEEIQFERVKRFLMHAPKYSVFYRRLFHEYNFKPELMQSVSDLSTLPVLTKETVRRQLSEIIPINVREYKVRWVHTSGTTGMGLQFPVSEECFQREYAFSSLHYLWGSIHLGSKHAFCSGHPVAYWDRRTPPFWVYDYANNWLLMSSYHLTEGNLRHYIAELEEFQPDVVAGYPSSIYLLALANQNLGKKVQPHAVYVSSETLFDFQREAIQKSFGCKVYVYYGNTEMCGNIVECERGKYHLKLEHSYIELLDEDHKAVPLEKEGNIIATGFGNYALPLIRYNVGDVAIMAKNQTCECGRGGKIIKDIIGRTEDYILTPDGRFIGRLDHLFKDSIHVKLAQIVQNSNDEIIIKVVKDRLYSERDEREILGQARLRLGSGIQIHFEYVEDIERTKRGKFRFIVSNIQTKRVLEKSLPDNS